MDGEKREKEGISLIAIVMNICYGFIENCTLGLTESLLLPS